MPTLYVENVPQELYDALKALAQAHRRSMGAEVIELLAENVPTASELARRRELFNFARSLRSMAPASSGPFPTAEEMLREDRER